MRHTEVHTMHDQSRPFLKIIKVWIVKKRKKNNLIHVSITTEIHKLKIFFSNISRENKAL